MGYAVRDKKEILKIRWLLAVIIPVIWLFGYMQSAYAVDAYIDAQPADVEIGQDVEVTVVFSGDNVGRVRAVLEYDPNVLSYQGDGDDSGTVSLSMAGTGDSIVYQLPFKAVGAGDSTLSMTPLDAYDLDEMNVPLPEQQTMSVKVSAPEGAKPDTAAQTEKTEQPDPDVQETQKPATDTDNAGKTDKEDKEEHTRSNLTIWLLGGVVLVLGVVLAVLVARRRN